MSESNPPAQKKKIDKAWLGDRVIQTVLGAIVLLTISIVITVVWGSDDYTRWTIIVIAMFIFISIIALYYKRQKLGK